jgi:hypothetical protein
LKAPAPRPAVPDDPIRAELFGVERLEQHARSLAEAQSISVDPARGRRFDVVSRLDTRVSMRNLGFGAGGRMFAAGVRFGSDLAVHALDVRGRVLYSFGPSASKFIVPRRPPDGFIFPLDGGRVVFVGIGEEYVMEIYTEGGRPTGVRRRPELSKRFTRYVVRGAAAFPEGGFAVCACNIALREVGEPACVADLYGPDAEYEDTVPAPPGASLLAAGPDRALYFTSIGPRGITVVKAKIKEPGREVYRADRARNTTLD